MLTKEEKKILREHADKLIGWDKRVNPDWKKKWKYFIKRDYSWGNIIELNVFKIVQMREFMKNHSIVCQEEVDKQIKQMTEVIELGYKILEDEYEDDTHKWLRENSIPVTIISKSIKGETLKERINCIKEEITRLYNRGMFEDIISETEFCLDDPISKEAFEMRKEFIKDKDTRSVEDWLKDNNLTKKDISLSYTSEWINGNTDENNSEEFRRRLKEAWKERQKDIDKFFKLIAKHCDGWGD